MFCSKCGAKIEDGAKFCPECGAAAEDATEPQKEQHEITNDFVSISGKRAGEVAFWHFPVVLVFFLACAMAGEESVLLSWIFGVVAIVFLLKARLSIPRSVGYDSASKKIITNSNRKLNLLKKSINLAQIKNIRFRKVKLGFSAKQVISNPGEYFVIALDAEEIKKSVFLWIEKEDEFNSAKEFILNAFKSENIEISVDENMSLMPHKTFYAER